LLVTSEVDSLESSPAFERYGKWKV